MKPAPVAKAAIIAAVFCCPAGALGGCLDLSTRGFQFRNAVHILHGFPSGPMTIPGGRGFDDELDELEDIATPAVRGVWSGRRGFEQLGLGNS